MAHSEERILIVRLSHLGDVVQSLPLFHALRAAHPRAHLGWVVQSEYAELLEGIEGLDSVLPFHRRGGLSAWYDLSRRLQRFGATWSVDGQGNSKSAMVALAAGAPRRSGFDRRDWRERFAAHSATDRAPAAEGPHAVARTLALAHHVAPNADPASPIRLDPSVTAEELQAGHRELEHRFGAPLGQRPLVICALATPGDPRSYPTDPMLEVARRLAARDVDVLVLSGPDEQAEGERGQQHLAGEPRIAHWVGQRGLRSLAGACAAAARLGGTLVASDSGPAHLAAACGMRVVLLAGPQDPKRTGPWPPVGSQASRHHALTRPGVLDCRPCLRRQCRHPLGPVCLTELEPETVVAYLLDAVIRSDQNGGPSCA